MPNPRFVRKDRRIYHDSHCLLCGANYGIGKGELRACKETRCMACGSAQCMVNGLGRGQCSICLVGLLPGWSGTDRPCQYKGCTERAIARVSGANHFRCRTHLERGKWAGYVARQLAARDQDWSIVDASLITERL